MGFEKLDALEAVKAVGKPCDDAVEYILKGNHRTGGFVQASSLCSTRNNKTLGKRAMPSSFSSGSKRQSSFLDHFRSVDRSKKLGDAFGTAVVDSQLEKVSDPSELQRKSFAFESSCFPETNLSNGCSEASSTWEKRVISILRNRFGISPLRSFQREVLSMWVAHKDCLVLAATGSDSCIINRKGQVDNRIEQKAMQGLYQIIYVCPETVVRLIKPLQKLAKTRGIALFAIDEAHCKSKWGHDFRSHYRYNFESQNLENFCASNLEFLEYDVSIMALTATATVHVQEDILESLHLSKETKTVLTSIFRPNLQFSVKHCRTKFASSYAKDFQNLIELYSEKRKATGKKIAVISRDSEEQIDFGSHDAENIYETDYDGDEEDAEISSVKKQFKWERNFRRVSGR